MDYPIQMLNLLTNGPNADRLVTSIISEQDLAAQPSF